MTSSDGLLQIGSLFEGRYEILGELGSGSFGRVFKARQLSTGQLVAVKVLRLPAEGAEADFQNRMQRFRREASLCAELSHPNVVRLIDSGEAGGGALYAAFEFVPGCTLREVLAAEGKLEIAEAVHLMSQVLDALSCAHAHGIVHRDLKPENIMITKTGARRNALVLDFGLGGFTREAEIRALPRLTATQDLLGTPSYAAPEQLRGEPTTIRSDFYSWGLIFLECLTGELVMGGASPHEVILKQLGPEPIVIPKWLQNHPLGRALEVVTAKRVEKRDSSVESLLRVLTTVGMGGLSDASETPSLSAAMQLERRQLTILCCRLVISAEGGQQADVEETAQQLQVHHASLTARAERAGGAIVSVTGNRVFVVFGYPHAREDDARRAARVAVEVVGESRVVAGRLRVDVGVGLHTGLVIVRGSHHGVRGSHHGASPSLQELTGLTPEISLQLAERAAPGQVLVSVDVLRLLRNEFDFEPREDFAMSALSRPLPVFRLICVRRSGGETESAAWSHDTPLVGRGHQLQQLLDAWQRAREGQGGVIVLVGEAGIGKSRLLRELRRRGGMEGWVELDCAEENQTTPLRPVIDALLAMDRSIESLLSRFGVDLEENLHLFAALLSLPVAAQQTEIRLSPERQKELTLRALLDLLFRMAASRPLVLAIENLHWADPTTLELIALLVQELRTARQLEAEAAPRVLVVCTTRPELIPAWGGEDVALLPLQRLMRADVEEMAKAALGVQSPLAPALVEQVVQRAEGVPLFVEELTRVVIEFARRADGELDLAVAPWGLEIPSGLRDLLTARLDHVSAAARETAQLAAVLGREFNYDVLQAVSSKDEVFLREDVDELGRAGLVLQRRSAQKGNYVFRHALLRDAAYEAMTRSTRRELHQLVAHVLHQHFPEIEGQRPEILALHYEQGGELAPAVDYWSRAWNESYRRAAYAEALSQVDHALGLVRTLDSSPENRRREVDLLVARGTTLMTTRGWAVPEVEETFGRAWDLCSQLGGKPPLMVLHGIWAVRITRSDRIGVEALLPRLSEMAEDTDPSLVLQGHSCLGAAAFWHGEFMVANDHLEEALRHYGVEAQSLAYDAGLYALAFGFCNLWMLGYAERANNRLAEALAIAERRRDPYSLGIVLGFGSMLALDCGDVVLARQWGERLMSVADEQRLFNWWAPAACSYGRALLSEGRIDEAIRFIQKGLERYRTLGVMASYTYYQTYLAIAYLEADRLAEAAAAIEEGVGLCRTLWARFHEPELLRLRGEVLRRQGDAAGAERCLRAAITVAERDGSRAYTLRAATDLARLLADLGKREEAGTLLAPIYEQFTEGFETRDLRDAKAFLRALASGDLNNGPPHDSAQAHS